MASPPTPPIDLRMLQVFLTVSDSGSMTSAAQQLGLTQSAVSQSLRQLESELKVSLFARDHRPLQLTAAGILLRDRAARLLEQASQLPSLVQEIGSAVLPVIRIGLVDSFASTVGPQLIRELLQSAVQLSVYCGLAPMHADALRRRAVDLIITSNPTYDVKGLERHRILREPFILLTPAAIAQEASRLSLEEMARRFPLIRYSARSTQGAQVELHLRRLGINVPQTVEIDTSDTLVAMVAAGCGWAITTPLCYLQGRAHAVGAVPSRFPGSCFSRSIMLIAHMGDYAELPRRVAQQAQRILSSTVLPEIERLAPWLTEEMVVGSVPADAEPDSTAAMP